MYRLSPKYQKVQVHRCVVAVPWQISRFNNSLKLWVVNQRSAMQKVSAWGILWMCSLWAKHFQCTHLRGKNAITHIQTKSDLLMNVTACRPSCLIAIQYDSIAAWPLHCKTKRKQLEKKKPQEPTSLTFVLAIYSCLASANSCSAENHAAMTLLNSRKPLDWFNPIRALACLASYFLV